MKLKKLLYHALIGRCIFPKSNPLSQTNAKKIIFISYLSRVLYAFHRKNVGRNMNSYDMFRYLLAK